MAPVLGSSGRSGGGSSRGAHPSKLTTSPRLKCSLSVRPSPMCRQPNRKNFAPHCKRDRKRRRRHPHAQGVNPTGIFLFKSSQKGHLCPFLAPHVGKTKRFAAPVTLRKRQSVEGCCVHLCENGTSPRTGLSQMEATNHPLPFNLKPSASGWSWRTRTAGRGAPSPLDSCF